MKLTPKVQGHLIILVAMMIFGLNIPANKFLYAHNAINPIGLTLLRMSFASLAFWLFSLFIPRERVPKKDLCILLVGGIMGMAINQGCFAYGISVTSPIDTSIIATSAPMFTLFISYFILKEPITLKKISGVVIASIGAIILVYSSSRVSNTVSSWQGNVAIFTAQFFYSMYLVITKPLSERYHPVTMMKWMFLVAMIILFPFGISDVISAPMFHVHEPMYYWALIFILFCSTFIAYALIPLAQKRIRPTTIAVYNNMQPFIASIVAIASGMDTFSLEKGLSALLIVTGVYFVTMSKSRKELLALQKNNK